MEINEMLDKAKLVLELETDYQLAQELGVSTARITELRQGKRPSVYFITKLSVILGADPMQNIAMHQAEKAKNEKQRGFWKNFFSIAGLWIILAAGLAFYSPTSDAGQTAGRGVHIDLKAHYAKWNGLEMVIIMEGQSPLFGRISHKFTHLEAANDAVCTEMTTHRFN